MVLEASSYGLHIQHAERIPRYLWRHAGTCLDSGCVLAELGLRLLESTSFFLDSQSVEDLAMNPVYHKQYSSSGACADW